ncbi:MAG: biotin transporter BioY [Clostridiales bacterium]|nr:biotin transporter BioY [Clostridiales bacterium]
MKIRSMVFTALFAAVICAVAPFIILLPFSPVPLSLATFIIYIAASLMNWKTGTLAVALYLLIGMIGLPVFSGFQGGVHKLIGPTGGFLIGYIPCALVIGLLVDRFENRKWLYPAAMVLGTAVLYACGTVWFMVSMKYTLAVALMACVVPFLIGDAVKIILASVIAPILRKALKKQIA